MIPRRHRLALLVPATLAAMATAHAQGPTFEAISIKLNTSGELSSHFDAHPNGGIVARNIPVGLLITRAFPPFVPADMLQLPEWAMKNLYDVTATSSLARADENQRAAMLRAMLADRFAFSAHAEPRSDDVYELVIARRDGSLGPQLKKIDTDCATILADRTARPASQPPFDPKAPVPACMLILNMTRLDGDTTMENLAKLLRLSGRRVVDRTGLAGYYHVLTNFNPRPGGPAPPGVQADSLPSVFTAIKEDLGLELKPARADVPKLIIDRISLPTED